MLIRDLLAEHRPDDDGASVPAAGDTTPDRPDWLEPEFKTPEDQARAYASARTEMKRAQSERDLEVKRMQEEFTQALSNLEGLSTPAQQQYNPQTDPTLVAYGRALEEGDYGQALAIQQMVNQASTQQIIREELAALAPQIQSASGVSRDVALRLAEQEVAPRFGDRWSELAPQVEAAIRSKPGLLPDQGSVETFSAILEGEAKLIEYERLQSEARQNEAARQDKLAAQTLSGDTARVPTNTDEKKAEWDLVKQADTGDVPW